MKFLWKNVHADWQIGNQDEVSLDDVPVSLWLTGNQDEYSLCWATSFEVNEEKRSGQILFYLSQLGKDAQEYSRAHFRNRTYLILQSRTPVTSVSNPCPVDSFCQMQCRRRIQATSWSSFHFVWTLKLCDFHFIFWIFLMATNQCYTLLIHFKECKTSRHLIRWLHLDMLSENFLHLSQSSACHHFTSFLQNGSSAGQKLRAPKHSQLKPAKPHSRHLTISSPKLC